MVNSQELLNQVGNLNKAIFIHFKRRNYLNNQIFNKLYKFFLILFKKISQFVPIKCNNKIMYKKHN